MEECVNKCKRGNALALFSRDQPDVDECDDFCIAQSLSTMKTCASDCERRTKREQRRQTVFPQLPPPLGQTTTQGFPGFSLLD
jgi:hypothetical protein